MMMMMEEEVEAQDAQQLLELQAPATPHLMLREMVDALFPAEDDDNQDGSVGIQAVADEDDQASDDEEEEGGHHLHSPPPATPSPVRKRRRRLSASAVWLYQQQQDYQKQTTTLVGGNHNDNNDDDTGRRLTLLLLPDECVREVASFLGPGDLYPTFALICRKLSHCPAVVPMLLQACPRDRRYKALMKFAASSSSSCSLANSSTTTPTTTTSSACEKLVSLELARLQLGDKGVERLFEAMQQGSFPSLRSLCLLKNGLVEPTTFHSLALGLPYTLQSLCLSHNMLGDHGLGHLARAFGQYACPKLQVLQLAHCGIGEMGIAALSQAMGSSGACMALKKLSLAHNDLGEAGTLLLLQGLRDGGVMNLEELRLAYTGMGHVSSQRMADGVEGGELLALTTLDVEGNRLGDEGVEALATAWVRSSLGHKREMMPPQHMTFLERSQSIDSTVSCHDEKDDGEGKVVQVGERALLMTSSSSSSSSSSTQQRLPLVSLNLRGTHFGDRAIRALGHTLQLPSLLSNLKVLVLADNNITPMGAANFFESLQQASEPLHALMELHLANNHLGDDGLVALAACAAQGHLPNLVHLDLSTVFLGPVGCRALAQALQPTTAPSPLGGHWPHLRRLRLGGNALGDEGLAVLANAWQANGTPELETLDMRGCDVGDTGITSLAEAVGQGALSCLKHLVLADTNIQSEGLRRLALAFRTRAQLGATPQLETLDLGRRRMTTMTDDDPPVGGIQALGTYFLAAILSDGAIPRLSTLQLGGNGIGRSGLYLLHIAFRNDACAQLKTLDLDATLIGDIGVGYLAISLLRGGCPHLQALRLGHCDIGDAGIKHLAHAFGSRRVEQRQLRSLYLADNAIGPNGLAQFCQQARSGAFPVLRHLSLQNNHVADDGVRGLTETLRCQALGKLQTLELQGNGVQDEEAISQLCTLMAHAKCELRLHA